MDGSIPLQQPGLGVWWSTWSISTPRPSAKCVAAVWDSLAVKQEGSVRTLDQATQGNVVKVQSALMVLEYFFSECQFGFNCYFPANRHAGEGLEPPMLSGLLETVEY
jgi:hypothetical protein